MDTNATKKEYTVSWEIEIWAASPQEAAEMARQIQLDPGNQATHFTVHDEHGDYELNAGNA